MYEIENFAYWEKGLDFPRSNPDVSMYEIENFAYWEKGLDFPRSNPVSHVSGYMYVCMGVGEGVCLWGEGRGVSVG